MRIQMNLLSTDNIPAIVGEMTQHLMKFSFDRIEGVASVTIDMKENEFVLRINLGTAAASDDADVADMLVIDAKVIIPIEAV